MKSMLCAAILMVASLAHAEQFLVKYKNQAALQQIGEMAALQANDGFKVLENHTAGSYVLVDIPGSTQTKLVGYLMTNPSIEWITPNITLYAFEAPEPVTSLRAQWAMDKVQAIKAWARAGNRGSRQVTVAVIDTGADYNHPNLAGNMVAGHDFKDNTEDPMDQTGRNPGHGTHCAGVIGANGLVEGGTIGISPTVSVMPLRFLGPDGSGDLNNAIKAIDYAIEKHVQVISASWGGAVSRAKAQPLIEAVQRASDHGVIMVMAAANNGKSNDETEIFPASAIFDNTITVAASDQNDTKPSWSNYGRATVHLASPGQGIMSTLPGNKYGALSGTSMATPLVAGLVALLKAQDHSLTGAQIRALLQTTGAAAAGIETACNCRIDAFAAVDQLMAKRPWLVPAAATFQKGETVHVAVVNGRAPFRYATDHAEIASIDDTGTVHGVAGGTAKVSVTDATGVVVSSLDYRVMDPSQPPPSSGGKCSVSDGLCKGICRLFPALKMCK